MRFNSTSTVGSRVLAALAATLATFAFVALAATNSARADFGVEAFDQRIVADPAGDPYTQAGGHPYAITTDVAFNAHVDPLLLEELGRPIVMPDEEPKDALVNEPPGLLGNATVASQCTEEQLAAPKQAAAGQLWPTAECPISSIVGTIHVESPWKVSLLRPSGELPLYNMVPPAGMPAKFGFNLIATFRSRFLSMGST
jgi:hypothetical protein